MHMTNFDVNKQMITVVLSLVSLAVKMVVVGIRVKGRQGGGRSVFQQLHLYEHTEWGAIRGDSAVCAYIYIYIRVRVYLCIRMQEP